MKIHFTLFNDGQEKYCFDTKILKKGEKLERFLIRKDERGIYVLPMVGKGGLCRYAGAVLEKLES